MNDIDHLPFAGDRRPPVALIAGPTASGKSGLAIALARALHDAGRGAVVVNADASQVYADIPILSAAPPAAERAGVDHRLFGHIDGAVAHNAAAWAAEARAAVADAHGRGAIPILVGGTGLYLRTLIDGIAPVPAIDADVRARVRAMAIADAHAALAARDPAAAARLHPHDGTRIARALEVVESSGRTLGHWQSRRSGGIGDAIRLVPLILLPPRDWLRDRCEGRFDAMVRGGAADEVAALLARRLDPALPVMNAIGVREIAGWIAGDTDRDAAQARAVDSTRQYAKRQYTWFRHQPPGQWERSDVALNDQETEILAIKLRQRLLTG